jgi:molecular chaperone GrpE
MGKQDIHKQHNEKDQETTEQSGIEEKVEEEENAEKETIDQNIAELEEKVSLFEEKYKRALADYHNLEKRMAEQRSEWIRSANKDLLLRLLPIFDTLILAQRHSEDKTLQVTVGQFLDVLKSEGATKIDVMGKEFDPHIMEAIATGEGEENKVVEELRIGFMLHDKVLRPAQVMVGKEN